MALNDFLPHQILATLVKEADSPHQMWAGHIYEIDIAATTVELLMPQNPNYGHWVIVKNATESLTLQWDGVCTITPSGVVDERVEVPNDLGSTMFVTTSFNLTTPRFCYRFVYTTNGWTIDLGYSPTALDRMKWKDAWYQDTYQANDVVRDGDYTMVANKQTDERPAPQPVGDPVWRSGLGDTPAWSSLSPVASYVITGQRYTTAEGGFANKIRIWIPATGPSLTYEVWSVDDPTGPNPAATVWVPSFVATETGWQEFPIGQILLPAGATFDLFLITQDLATSTTFNGNWDYQTPQNARTPTAGEIIHSRRDPHEMAVHKTDNDAGDRSAELANMGPGDEITGGTVTWTILSVTDNGTWIMFEVTPTAQISTGVQNFTFKYYGDVATQYSYITDHYLADAQVQGFVSITGYDNIALNQNAYGVDIEVQDALVSEDWDLLALNSDAGGGTGGGTPTPPATIHLGDFVDALSSYAPGDNSIYFIENYDKTGNFSIEGTGGAWPANEARIVIAEAGVYVFTYQLICIPPTTPTPPGQGDATYHDVLSFMEATVGVSQGTFNYMGPSSQQVIVHQDAQTPYTTKANTVTLSGGHMFQADSANSKLRFLFTLPNIGGGNWDIEFYMAIYSVIP